jgi:hypothetical protein
MTPPEAKAVIAPEATETPAAIFSPAVAPESPKVSIAF